MKFPCVAMIGKYQDLGIALHLKTIAEHLKQLGHKVLFEQQTAKNTGITDYDIATIEQIGQLAQAAIVVGGDGTMLGIARQLACYSTPLIGINHGRLGFMTDIPLEQCKAALSAVLGGAYVAEKRTLLSGSIIRGDKTLLETSALNDVVINRAGQGGMIELSIAVDHQFMANQRADGLIVATPTGSTAYSLSANGPILHPQLQGIALVPIAPQTLSNRPITLPDSCVVEITLMANRNARDIPETHDAASVHFDMQTWSLLMPGDRIIVKRSPHQIQFLHPEGYTYFSTLRRKLHWNLSPRDNHLVQANDQDTDSPLMN